MSNGVVTGSVIQVVACINENIGGPAVSVSRLAHALVSVRQPALIVTLDYPNHGRSVAGPGVEVISIPAGRVSQLSRGYSSAFRDALNRVASSNTLAVHNHGLWMYPNLCARRTAQRNGIPLVISPRGMLEPWSLARSRMKKVLAWHWYEYRNLRSAQMFHATSESELESIRRLGFRQPVAVIPNGIDVPDTTIDRAPLESRFPELTHRRWILFLSRLHPKKGLVDLIEAWSRLANDHEDVQLVIAGPDLDGYQAELIQRARSAGVMRRITFTGMLVDDMKESALSNADVFVLPTHSENFGMVIGEALSRGCPVITTTAAPWKKIQDARCGWWIPPGPESLRRALTAALATSHEERQQMGSRGRQLMRHENSWSKAGTLMKSAYEWMRHGGPRPSFIDG